jgi:hypothetical protein
MYCERHNSGGEGSGRIRAPAHLYISTLLYRIWPKGGRCVHGARLAGMNPRERLTRLISELDDRATEAYAESRHPVPESIEEAVAEGRGEAFIEAKGIVEEMRDASGAQGEETVDDDWPPEVMLMRESPGRRPLLDANGPFPVGFSKRAESRRYVPATDPPG